MKNDYSEFIEYLLHSEGKEFEKVGNEYRHQSFFSDDNTFSAVFYEDGFDDIYNGVLPIEGKTRYSVKDISKLTGNMTKFISWLCCQYDIPIYMVNRFKELKNQFYKSPKENHEMGVLLTSIKPMLKEQFISVLDLVSTDEININKVIKSSAYKKKSKSKSEIIEHLDNISTELIQYTLSRGLEISPICYPCRIEMKNDKGSSFVEAIALKYNNGFTKYRLYNGFTRYLSFGNYEELYWVRKEGNNKLIMVEGEIETLCLSYITKGVDLCGMHNCSAVRTSCDLTKYDEVIVMIDLDKFEASSKVIEGQLKKYGIKNYIIISKFDDVEDEKGNKIDINSEFIKNKENLYNYVDNRLNI